MKFETVLNATLKANFNRGFGRRLQYYTFYTWLLRRNEKQAAEIARLKMRLSTERSILDNAPVWSEMTNCPPETVIGIRYEQIIKWQDEIARLKAQIASLERIIARETEKAGVYHE
jgi:hypothetical protein